MGDKVADEAYQKAHDHYSQVVSDFDDAIAFCRHVLEQEQGNKFIAATMLRDFMA